jgi:hypothetical protein
MPPFAVSRRVVPVAKEARSWGGLIDWAGWSRVNDDRVVPTNFSWGDRCIINFNRYVPRSLGNPLPGLTSALSGRSFENVDATRL